MSDNANAFFTWTRGWSHGAGARGQDEKLSAHPGLGALYLEAWKAGFDARRAASRAASERFGYQPQILRICTPPNHGEET